MSVTDSLMFAHTHTQTPCGCGKMVTGKLDEV